MDNEIKRAYYHLRQDHIFQGSVDGVIIQHRMPASSALMWARREVEIQQAWDEAGDNVRIRKEPDLYFDFDEDFGDTFDCNVNDDINPNVIKKQKKAVKEQISIYGVWILIGEYKCGHCGSWVQADVLGGIIGEDDMGMNEEVMMSTLKEYHEHKHYDQHQRR